MTDNYHIRYIVVTKDKSKFLSYRGFTDYNHIHDSNPKLYPSACAARLFVTNAYSEAAADDCDYIKIKVTYEEFNNED